MNTKIIPIFIFTILLTSIPLYSLTPDEILKASDGRLFPEIMTYQMTIETAMENGRQTRQVMTGYRKGNTRNVLLTLEPKRYQGTAHLRKDNLIWSYFSTNKRLAVFSYKAIFMGTVLNYGDVFATELSFDYSIDSLSEDNTNFCIVMKICENHEGYAKINLFVDKSTLLPVRKEYFALSGITNKICNFKEIEYNNKNILNKMVMEFIEPIKHRTTVVTFDEVKIVADISEKYFNENYLKFLGGE